jgi:hypothetical protein
MSIACYGITQFDAHVNFEDLDLKPMAWPQQTLKMDENGRFHLCIYM